MCLPHTCGVTDLYSTPVPVPMVCLLHIDNPLPYCTPSSVLYIVYTGSSQFRCCKINHFKMQFYHPNKSDPFRIKQWQFKKVNNFVCFHRNIPQGPLQTIPFLEPIVTQIQRSHANRDFYELKQCQKNDWIQKMDRVN